MGTGLWVVTISVYNKYEELIYSQEGGQIWQYSAPDIDRTNYMISESDVYAEEVPESPLETAMGTLDGPIDFAEKHIPVLNLKKPEYSSTVIAVSAAGLLAIGACRCDHVAGQVPGF